MRGSSNEFMSRSFLAQITHKFPYQSTMELVRTYQSFHLRDLFKLSGPDQVIHLKDW